MSKLGEISDADWRAFDKPKVHCRAPKPMNAKDQVAQRYIEGQIDLRTYIELIAELPPEWWEGGTDVEHSPAHRSPTPRDH